MKMVNDVKFNFDGKTVVITGCARGIGQTIAVEFGKAGANVVTADINVKGAEDTADTIKALNGNASAIALDVSDEKSIKATMDFAIEKYGQIDILVNNAAIAGAHKGMPLTGWEASGMDRMYEINFRSVLLATQAVYDHMVERRSGKIINMASVSGKPPLGEPDEPLWLDYASMKAAVVQLTRYIAIEMGAYNINVNAICPGTVHTEMWDEAAERLIKKFPDLYKNFKSAGEYVEAIAEGMPMKRLQTAEDMAYLAMFLASDASKNINGQAINVCGGCFFV